MLEELISGAASSLLNNNNGGGQSQAIELFSQLANQHGGVGGLLNQLQGSGLAEVAQSWIGHGENMNVDASQIQNVFGSSLGQAAANVGMDNHQASSLLSQFLPQIINAITPNGNAADANGFGMDDIARIALNQMFK